MLCVEQRERGTTGTIREEGERTHERIKLPLNESLGYEFGRSVDRKTQMTSFMVSMINAAKCSLIMYYDLRH